MKGFRPKHLALIAVWLSMLLISCDGGKVNAKAIDFQKISDVPDSVWNILSGKKLYFGHQSVGYNIVQGIAELEKEYPQIQLKIQETYDPDEFLPGTFSHSRIGYNGDPESKIKAFAFYMKSGGGNKVDFAFFKLCYVDFWAETDVEKLFDIYQKNYNSLHSKYPETTFLHFTVPLTTIQSGFKADLKKLFGKTLDGTSENIKRNQFNELMRKAYGQNNNFFDLAKVESTFPDGQRSVFQENGKQYYSLAQTYTKDGGHLNELGRRIVAEQVLLTLARLV